MIKEAQKAKTDLPETGKAAALEEARKSAAEKVASMSNSTMDAYCEDNDSIETTED